MACSGANYTYVISALMPSCWERWKFDVILLPWIASSTPCMVQAVLASPLCPKATLTLFYMEPVSSNLCSYQTHYASSWRNIMNIKMLLVISLCFQNTFTSKIHFHNKHPLFYSIGQCLPTRKIISGSTRNGGISKRTFWYIAESFKCPAKCRRQLAILVISVYYQLFFCFVLVSLYLRLYVHLLSQSSYRVVAEPFYQRQQKGSLLSTSFSL